VERYRADTTHKDALAKAAVAYLKRNGKTIPEGVTCDDLSGVEILVCVHFKGIISIRLPTEFYQKSEASEAQQETA
jgi:hypothetical protein